MKGKTRADLNVLLMPLRIQYCEWDDTRINLFIISDLIFDIWHHRTVQLDLQQTPGITLVGAVKLCLLLTDASLTYLHFHSSLSTSLLMAYLLEAFFDTREGNEILRGCE